MKKSSRSNDTDPGPRLHTVNQYLEKNFPDFFAEARFHVGNDDYFLSHPKLELLVNIESLEFPVDGLAQAVVSVATVELTDPDLQRMKVEFRRMDGGWKVVRADRVRR